MWLALGSAAAPARGADTRDLQIPPSRIPQWYTPSDNGFPVNTLGWTTIDVTSQASIDAAIGTGLCTPLFPDDEIDDAPALECLSNQIGESGTVLFFPAGQYDLDSGNSTPGGLFIADFGTDNTLLLGAGVGQTVFEYGDSKPIVFQCDDRGSASFCEGSHLWIFQADWTGGYARDDDVLTISDTTGLAPGDWIALHQDEYPPGGPNPCSPDCEFRHMTRIAEVDNPPGTIRIDRPLMIDWTAPGRKIYRIASRMPDRVGIEGIDFRADPPGRNVTFVNVYTATHAWLKDNRFGAVEANHVEITAAARFWIHGNIFQTLTIDENGGHSSLKLRAAQHGVIERNAFDDLRVGIELDQGSGFNLGVCCTMGTAITYNYFFPVRRFGDPNVADDSRDGCVTSTQGVGGGRGRHIFLHGPGSHGNLWEGNHAYCYLQWDSVFNAARGLMIFRNRVLRVKSEPTGLARCFDAGLGCSGKIGQECAAAAGKICSDISVVANHTQDVLSGTSGAADAHNDDLWYERNVAAGCILSDDNAFVDPQCSVQEEEIVDPDLNWLDQATGTPQAPPPAWDNFEVPDSFVYPTTPSWWCQEGCPYTFDKGIGALADDSSKPYCKLPAQILIDGDPCTPWSDTDGDAIADMYDNCADFHQTNQYDSDLDGYGNRCDHDLDNDGVVGLADLDILEAALPSVCGQPNYNPDADFEGDCAVGLPDYDALVSDFGGTPGPSNLPCAGTIPCTAHYLVGDFRAGEPAQMPALPPAGRLLLFGLVMATGVGLLRFGRR